MPEKNVVFNEINNSIGQITLNRPGALNALNLDMIQAIDHQLEKWANDKHIKAVVIRTSNNRAFCAGGDIREIFTFGRQSIDAACAFFRHEYCLNDRIYHYPKPYIAFMDGLTMGGGAGISIHGSYRIATEHFSFAMPETGIGFFPDIGASHFLSHCPGYTGIYLGLTGTRINATDAIMLGLADTFIASNTLDAYINMLIQSNDIHELFKLHTPAPSTDSLLPYWQEIDRCFSASTIEEILEKLSQQQTEWHQKTIQTLREKSPTSLKVTLRQLQISQEWDLHACLQMEYGLATHFLKQPDFYEGIRAMVIDKDRSPHWSPNALELVSESHVNNYFLSDYAPILSFEP